MAVSSTWIAFRRERFTWLLVMPVRFMEWVQGGFMPRRGGNGGKGMTPEGEWVVPAFPEIGRLSGRG